MFAEVIRSQLANRFSVIIASSSWKTTDLVRLLAHHSAENAGWKLFLAAALSVFLVMYAKFRSAEADRMRQFVKQVFFQVLELLEAHFHDELAEHLRSDSGGDDVGDEYMLCPPSDHVAGVSGAAHVTVASLHQRLEAELHQYAQRAHSPEQPLEFWPRQAKAMPLLARMAELLIALPVTSASSERLFSIVDDILPAVGSAATATLHVRTFLRANNDFVARLYGVQTPEAQRLCVYDDGELEVMMVGDDCSCR